MLWYHSQVTLSCLLVILLWLQMYASLEAAYAALAERLNGSDGDYIFGAKPSSLDALLYGHLAFHQAAPVSSPEIQHQVGLMRSGF